jgi:predicted phosphoribosyltransferase
VGQWYEQFPQTSDEEVLELLGHTISAQKTSVQP